MIKVFALDDDEVQLKIFAKSIRKFNEFQSEDTKIDLHLYTDPNEFILKIDDSVDLAIIDRDLKRSDIDGYDVARSISRITPKTVFLMISSSYDDREDFDTYVSKSIKYSNLVSEIVSRFRRLQHNSLLNLAEFMFGQEYYPETIR